MSKDLVEHSTMSAIAQAIRAKLGVSTTYKPGQMAAAIGSIETPNLESLTVSANGSYSPTSPKNGFSSVSVNVAGGGAVTSGTSVPSSASGNDGDTYFRYDSTSGALRAVYVKQSGAWVIFWTREIVFQQVSIGVSYTIAFPTEDSAQVTYTDTSENPSHDWGVVFATNRWNPYISVSGSDTYIQMGRCTKTASLPTITSQGTGREDFNGPTQNALAHSYEFRDASNFFAEIFSSSPGSRTIAISKS